MVVPTPLPKTQNAKPSDLAPAKSIAVWLSGYYNGLQHNSVVDLGRMEQNIDKVQDFCRLNMDMKLMDAAKKALSASK